MRQVSQNHLSHQHVRERHAVRLQRSKDDQKQQNKRNIRQKRRKMTHTPHNIKRGNPSKKKPLKPQRWWPGGPPSPGCAPSRPGGAPRSGGARRKASGPLRESPRHGRGKATRLLSVGVVTRRVRSTRGRGGGWLVGGDVRRDARAKRRLALRENHGYARSNKILGMSVDWY